MKSLIVYSSQSGNTKKLAEAVYESLKGDKEIYPIAEAPEPADYDFFAIGFWLKAGKPDPATLEYLPKIGSEKKIFLFATHGADPDSDHAKSAIKYAIDLIPSAEIVNTYNCQGGVNPEVLGKILEKPDPPNWVKDAPNAAGHPDEKDIINLKKLVSSL